MYNKINFSMWTKLGMRASFGLGATEIGKKVENLMILTGDVSTSAGLDRFKKKYPEKYLDVGIAEQNLIGIGAGLSSEGFKVITTTFAPFQTMRCCEQIKVNLGYMKQKISMVGLASGLVLGPLGYTHCCIEDIGVLRSIPNLTIISPADSTEAIKSIEASLEHKYSTYVRLSGGSNLKQIYFDDFDFQIGKAVTLKEGGEICIIATGTMVGVALECHDILFKKNIKTEIVNMHTIKPIDKSKLKQVSKKVKLIITLEEHNIIGGLGSAVSEVISEFDYRPKVLKYGIDDRYTAGGEYNYLKDKFSLSPETISENIIKELK